MALGRVFSLLLLAGCSGLSSSPIGSIASDVAAPPSWLNQQGDSADTGCNVVLRQSYVNLNGRAGPETNCVNGSCWVVFHGDFDVSNALVAADAEPGVLYQSAVDNSWREAAALPSFGAGLGYRRYSYTLNRDTFVSGPGSQTVNLIPFVRTVAGGRGFDHNRILDTLGSYSCSPQNDWAVPADNSCPAAAPRATDTLSFAQGWQNSGSGSLVQNGKLDINYDIYRIPSGFGCTQDSVPAFAVTAYLQVQPGGALFSERIDGPFDSTSGKYQSLPLEFDVPAGVNQAALWFLDSSECSGDQWDSQFGANYVYPVAD